MHELTRFTDDALLGATSKLSAHDHRTTAALVAHLAEIDARRLYLGLGHPSMFAYVVETLHYSESAAYRRIQAARTARRFPRLFTLMAEARLHLAAICQLAPRLTEENFDELVAAAAGRSKVALERWLEVRFAPPLLLVAAAPVQLAPERVASEQPAMSELVPGRVEPAVAPGAPPAAAPAVAPHVVLRLALPPAMEARLRYAQSLLGHAVPGGDTVEVFGRALEALIRELERRKFARTERPRKPRARAARHPRSVPAHVKRAIWQRDEGRCAFVSVQGRRCTARSRLEFDHVVPVARGGTSRAEDLRLLCRAHNQFEAERVLGRAFVRRKREAARARQATLPGKSCDAAARAAVLPGTQEAHPGTS